MSSKHAARGRKIVPIRTLSHKTRGKTDRHAVLASREWTTFKDLGGLSLTGFRDIALLIGRLQIHDRRATGARTWAEYPSNERFGWLAIGGKSGTRFLGIGRVTEIHTRAGESLIKLRLPFEGCGRELAERCGIYSYHADLRAKYGNKETGKTGPGAVSVAV